MLFVFERRGRVQIAFAVSYAKGEFKKNQHSTRWDSEGNLSRLNYLAPEKVNGTEMCNTVSNKGQGEGGMEKSIQSSSAAADSRPTVPDRRLFLRYLIGTSRDGASAPVGS